MERTFEDYNGGKAGDGTYQAIINCIPKCRVFVDMMAGGLGITSNLHLPELTIINDIDSEVHLRLCKVSEGMPGVVACNMDYERLFKMVKMYDDCVVYFDPPYHFSTRSTQQRYYKFDG